MRQSSEVARHVTLSLGIVTVEPPQASSASELIQRADAALYAAKRGGRNRWVAASALPPAETASG